MKTMAISIPTSLGEIINIKYHLDTIKQQYQQIRISFNKSIWKDCLHTEAPDWHIKQNLWDKYLNDIGNLFFKEPPYVLDTTLHPFYDTGNLLQKFRINPQKADLKGLLCRGESLNIGEYIVLTTKVRHLEKGKFFPLSIQFWKVLNQLSQKYKIVILGEREVEMRKEYDLYKTSIFGIYEQIISNLPAERLVDRSVPALGETVADLKDIQQDCLIMKEAKLVITLGVGGNFCMSTATANMTVGFRDDVLELTDKIFLYREYPDAIITKDWGKFIGALEKYT